MYGVINVELFIDRRAGVIPFDERLAIVDRAKALSANGVFSGSQVLDIFGGDRFLADMFVNDVMTCPVQIQAGMAAISALPCAAESDPDGT
jgi:hypothetical protein